MMSFLSFFFQFFQGSEKDKKVMAQLVPRVPIPTGHSFGELLQLEPEKFIKKIKDKDMVQDLVSSAALIRCWPP